MGGLAIAEINTAGKREVGYVYANGMELARYRKPSSSQGFEVQWTHAEPMTGDRIEGGVGSITTDPLGGLVPGSDPFVTPNVEYGDLLGERTSHTADSDPFSLGSGCSLDGVPIDCNVAINMANNGAASVAPINSVKAVVYQGEVVLAFWQSYADGREGFVPVNAVYTGRGGFRPAGPPKYSDLRTSKQGDTDFRALNGVSDDDPEALLAQSKDKVNPVLAALKTKVSFNYPKDQKTENGSLRECGIFNIKITVSNIPKEYLKKIRVSGITPGNYSHNGFNIIESSNEEKGDKVIYSATVQVGNIIGGGKFGAVTIRIYFPDPDYVPKDKPGSQGQEPVIGIGDLQDHIFHKDSSFDEKLLVKDTVLGVDEDAPFKRCR
jgi:hypothetical protein